MRHWPLFAFVLLASCLRTTRAQPATLVLDAETLEAAGVVRLTDLLPLIDAWQAVSLEGYTAALSAGGLAPFQAQAWTVMIDGHPVSPASPGSASLNTLPLHVLQIDSVTVVSRPVVVNGVPATAGLLHLHTRRPPGGLHLRAHAAAGNEIDDPGPFRYTPLATPNIDRIGPTYLVETSYARSRWFVRAAFVADEHHATDERIAKRVKGLYREPKPPRLMLLAGHVSAALSGRRGYHHVFAGYSRFRDLRFLAPLGRELPLEQHLLTGGIAGNTAPARPTGLRYRFSLSTLELGPRPNRRNLIPGWQRQHGEGFIEIRSGRPGVHLALGAIATYRHTSTSDPLDAPTAFVPRLHARVAVRPKPSWNLEGMLLLAHHTSRPGQPDRLGTSALVTTTIRPRPSHTIMLALAYLRHGIEEDNRPWYDVARGYAFFRRAGAEVVLPPSLPDGRTLTADLGWSWQVPSFRIEAAAFYRRFLDHHLAGHVFGVDPESPGFHTSTRVYAGVSGHLLGSTIRLRHRLDLLLDQTLGYTVLHPVPGNDAAFRQAWASAARHQVVYRTRFSPHPRLCFFGTIRFTSGTRWPAFASVGPSARRPAYLLADLGLQKRLWQEHLRLHLALRNLTNTSYRPHPAGAVTHLSLFAQIEARF
ncbi:TonB-dependent receptor [Rhodocaloribacter litoris]|uniref:TonB-dependent receptor n=1 Tax=Rhodocaloribacter litoris TaxID=2558931 RepID=UPI0014248427|nr:TonB-dependent receptor [Rhodocaloribacter litoris]QXD15272.1 TonB-dependent receptor [Rhodocaloribacter litoris]